MTASKVMHLRGVLTKISSQRVEYKPYGYELDFSMGDERPVIVEVDIPKEHVLEESEFKVVIGLDGLNALLEVTADSIDKLDRKYKQKIQKEAE